MKKSNLVLLLGFLTFGAQAQTITTDQYRYPKTEKDLNFNKAYLIGVKDGLIAYNNTSSEHKLFCVPENLSLTFEQASDIAMRWANKKNVDAHSLPIGLTLLYGLREIYPCH